MSYSIYLHANKGSAILERILRTTRVRGFVVMGLDINSACDDSPYEIAMRVDSKRPIDFLEKQLRKIHGVEAVHSLQQVDLQLSSDLRATS